MIKTYFKIFSVILFLLFCSCSNTIKNENIKKSDTSIETHKVEVITISPSTFKKQIIINGKLSAMQKADIYFKNKALLKMKYKI